MRCVLFHGAAVVLLVVILAGCGGLQEQIVPAEGAGKKVVDMRASSFSFEPNNLQVDTGDTLTFRIENTSVISHNFTLTDPDGETLQDVPLPSGEVTEVSVEFKKTGTYRINCDKPFHSAMGMQGQVVATE